MKEVAIKKCGLKLMRHFTGNGGFTATGNAHQDINVVIEIRRAQRESLSQLLRVTVIGNIVLPGQKRSNIQTCVK
ncbi:hypothetical protein D3C72_1893920 [compost metagenome]